MKALTCPYPDDTVLRLFVDDLTQRINDRITSMPSAKTRFRATQQFDEDMHLAVTKEQGVDMQTLSRAGKVIRDSKPRIDAMLSQVSKLKLEKN